jgi:hypothetical protein
MFRVHQQETSTRWDGVRLGGKSEAQQRGYWPGGGSVRQQFGAIPRDTRSGNHMGRPYTELVTASVYRGLGDGTVHYMKDSNELSRNKRSNPSSRRDTKAVRAETNLGRWDCIGDNELPTMAERGGSITRRGASYVSKKR